MAKIFEKSLRYLIIIIGIILLVPLILYPLIRLPDIQTLLITRITSHISEQIKSTISVGRVEFIFFNKLNLADVLIKDNNNDTLLYTYKASVGIRNIDWNSKTIILGRGTMINPVISFITDSTGSMNLRWYLDLLKQPEDTTKKKSISVIINQIDISNARFALVNKTGKRSSTPVDFNNLRLYGINGIVEDFNIRDDSTFFGIYNLVFKFIFHRSGLIVYI